MSPVPWSGTIGQSASWRLLCLWCYYPCSLGFFRAPAILCACCCAFIVVAPDLLLCVDFSVILWLQPDTYSFCHHVAECSLVSFALGEAHTVHNVSFCFVLKFESLEEVFIFYLLVSSGYFVNLREKKPHTPKCNASGLRHYPCVLL